ncbi:MAG TPA: helix-turn-helix transcriptional regulator [Verrucomicrobiae bacterium]|nr:helix-turn-helix transcriptional regulator [Verrucomicrobiae bacterium]
MEIGFRVDERLPVIPFSLRVSRAGCAAPHAHPRGQLIYAGSGVMRVVCRRDIWMVPPSQAVWVPPGIEHEVYFPGDVELRNLFVDPSVTAALPGECRVIRVSPLLRELVEKATVVGDDYLPGSSGYRLMLVILDELREAEPTDLHLPMGRDTRLLQVMDVLRADPGSKLTVGELAKGAGASTRTLARLFVRETGLTFADWRKRLLVQESLSRLGNGESVTNVAIDLGYQSLSAFVEMFRKATGAPPGHYVRQGRRAGYRRDKDDTT